MKLIRFFYANYMTVYRTKAIVPFESVEKNIFRYVLHESENCPLCGRGVSNWGKNLISEKCHPLKRLVVAGFWWWKKKCPIESVHYHTACIDCNIKWIRTGSKQEQYVANYEEKPL